MNYEQKYLKYKIKYQNLKNLLGGEIINGIDMDVIKTKLESIKSINSSLSSSLTTFQTNLETSENLIKNFKKQLKTEKNPVSINSLNSRLKTEEQNQGRYNASITKYKAGIKLLNNKIPEIENAIGKNNSNTTKDKKSIELLTKLITLDVNTPIAGWGI